MRVDITLKPDARRLPALSCLRTEWLLLQLARDSFLFDFAESWINFLKRVLVLKRDVERWPMRRCCMWPKNRSKRRLEGKETAL